MNLSAAQLATLKTDIQADGTLTTAVTAKSWQVISDAYNTLAAGPWTVWRHDVLPQEIVAAILMTEFVALTAIKQKGLDLLLNLPVIDATQPNIQTDFAAIFSAGTTLTALAALAKRSATRAEKLFSTGTGSVATPATVNVNARSLLTIDDVARAMG